MATQTTTHQAQTVTQDANVLDEAIKATATRKGVISTFALQYDLEPSKVMGIVAQTVFRAGKDEPPLSSEEVAAALIVCNAYNLNPFTKEIYAFRSKGKLLIVVGVDGWSAIVNRQQNLDGIEFDEHFDNAGNIQAVTCRIYRKDRSRPITVKEYTKECRCDTEPWRNMPTRMTRNRAFVQCARIAFSISGIVDHDEAQGIDGAPEYISSEARAAIDSAPTKTDAVKAAVRTRAAKAQQSEPPAATQTAQPDSQETPPAQSDEPVQQTTETQQTSPEKSGDLW